VDAFGMRGFAVLTLARRNSRLTGKVKEFLRQRLLIIFLLISFLFISFLIILIAVIHPGFKTKNRNYVGDLINSYETGFKFIK
jgi:hypothetical protein